MSEQLNIILNGKNITGFRGESILDLAARYSTEIPTLCHDPRLEPYTSCYLCVVEIEGMRGLQPACSTRIAEGMKINTVSDRVKKARKTALDLMLSNHYADCLGPCKQTCPAGVDVQGYIALIEKGMYSEAVALIKETNPFPAVCGRVCVRPCEVACRRNMLDEGSAVGIDYLKRFAADRDLASTQGYKPEIAPETGKAVAVIGAGPGGLSAAFFLRKEGHKVDVYEAAPAGGGWLRYGIPEYRLPNDVLQREIDNIGAMGVNIYYNSKLGDNLSYAEIQKKYDATVLGIGCQKGTSIGCEGDDAGNVLSGIDFLKTMEISGQRYDFSGKTVGVIGGGNTAMDCCRSALRCGAQKVYVVYRRTEKEMPANPIEIHESKLEGVEYIFLTAPVRVNKDDSGNIRSLTCIKMGLGEPDASGRRRPVPVEGSEFELEMDYALAAIGQKTVADFLGDINACLSGAEVKVNKWGDIDAHPETLQTGAAGIFACGDGVTGAATLIQAVAQARIAALSCHQFLCGQEIKPAAKEFISRRENFRDQNPSDYQGKYAHQMRHEMPTLPAEERNNFKEVELGYENEEVAVTETARCLECGCTEFFTCDLKRYATEYEADQKHYAGEFAEYQADFRHPYIEIDNNKCILCSRCVRICREVVGASALGLINRGFKTCVAPAMGNSLKETSCESCGMCISACPTGAITENYSFKPGPVRTEAVKSICNYCSVGCSISLNHHKGYVFNVGGVSDEVSRSGNICRYAKFGYHYMNSSERILKPLLRQGSGFTEISFEEAARIAAAKISEVKPDENVFFAGARLTNEEMYLIQKLARWGAGTHNVGSFHYLGRGDGYLFASEDNVPLSQLAGADKFYLFGSEINRQNAVAGFVLTNLQYRKSVPLEIITNRAGHSMKDRADDFRVIKDYYWFVRSVNHYLISNRLYNELYINDNCKGFEDYREALLKEDFSAIAGKACSDPMVIMAFADDFNRRMNAVLVFAEAEVTGATAHELRNLALLTGKLGKTSMGLIALKEKNNSQGLIDMGISPRYFTGGVPTDLKEVSDKVRSIWGDGRYPALTLSGNLFEALDRGIFRNMFIFGEDPVGTAFKPALAEAWLKKCGFVMVQDCFLTPTARLADLVLPSSLIHEMGGSFTNTGKVIRKTDPALFSHLRPETDSLSWIAALMGYFGSRQASDASEVMSEIASMLPKPQGKPYSFISTPGDSAGRYFDHGCDFITGLFANEFAEKMK